MSKNILALCGFAAGVLVWLVLRLFRADQEMDVMSIVQSFFRS